MTLPPVAEWENERWEIEGIIWHMTPGHQHYYAEAKVLVVGGPDDGTYKMINIDYAPILYRSPNANTLVRA